MLCHRCDNERHKMWLEAQAGQTNALKPFYTSRNIVYIDNTFLECPAYCNCHARLASANGRYPVAEAVGRGVAASLDMAFDFCFVSFN